MPQMVLDRGILDGIHPFLIAWDRYPVEYLSGRRRRNGIGPGEYSERLTGIALAVDYSIEIASLQGGYYRGRNPLETRSKRSPLEADVLNR